MTLIISFTLLTKAPENSLKLETGWKVTPDFNDNNINKVPYYQACDINDDFKTGNYVFSNTFNINHEISRPLLFIPYIAGNGIKVFIDDNYIGQAGDLDTGNSVIWNKAHIFRYPDELKKGKHSISIKIYGLYEYGILTVPFITDYEDGIIRKLFLDFYSQYIVEIISGILLVLGIIFITTGMKTHENYHVKLFMGLTLISLYLFLLDFSFIDPLPFNYLYFKKISISGIYLSGIFIIILINKILGVKSKKIDQIVIILNIIIIAIILFLPDKMTELRNIYKFTNPSIIIVFILIAYNVLSSREKTIQTNLLITGLSITFLIALYDIIQLILPSGAVFYTHIGITIFIVYISRIAVIDTVEIHTSIEVEKTRASKYQKDSLTDTLTGTHNRRMLTVLDQIIKDTYSVILFDMNKFKQINDTYGHSAGDIVLKKTADIIKEATRETDYLLRYGGDEFLLILPGCGNEKGSELEKRLQKDFFQITIDGKDIYFSFTSGLYTSEKGEKLDKAIKKADAILYKNKSNQEQ